MNLNEFTEVYKEVIKQPTSQFTRKTRSLIKKAQKFA